MLYFPLESDRFEHQFGIRRLARVEETIEVTEDYDDQIKLKRKALEDRQGDYFQMLDGSEPAQQEAYDWICQFTPFL